MRLIVTLFVLLFTQLFLNLAHASPQAHVSAEQKKGQISQASPDDRKKRKADRTTKKAKVTSDKTVSKNVTNKTIANNDKKKTAATASKVIKKKVQEVSNPTKKTNSNKTIPSKTIATKTPQIKTAAHKKVTVSKTEKVAYGRHRNKAQGKADTELAANNKIKLSPAHKKRYQHAKQTAMSKLMKQVGKPYRWGGTSPNTGFDCSGLFITPIKMSSE